MERFLGPHGEGGRCPAGAKPVYAMEGVVMVTKGSIKDGTVFTSESVTDGHPDKLADQISDAVLDEVLRKDTHARVACETAVTTGVAIVMGEITTSCYVDIKLVVRDVIHSVGYVKASYGFDYETCGVLICVDEQSGDIALGVDKGGAGDQGIMFGYACDETPELMPLPIQLAHALTRRLSAARKDGTLEWARPDGKSQVTVEYDGDGIARRLSTILVSAQHSPSATNEQIRHDLLAHVITPAIPAELMDESTDILINPTGRFVVGGPHGDAGLTGRKIVVDTYGGYARTGGGAFSGKDPSKVDRSGAYAARWVAKNIVAAGLARKCEVQLAYAIGVEQPVSVRIDAFNTERIPLAQIRSLVASSFDLTPRGIISTLDLLRPIYRQLSAFGHFGRPDIELPWEDTSMAVDLAAQAGVPPLDPAATPWAQQGLLASH